MTTTAHSVAPEDIMAFLDGELSASEAQTVSAHLKDCAQCAMVAEHFRATSEMLSRWDVEAAPAALEDSVKKLAAKAAAHRAVVKSRTTGFRGRRLLVIGSGAVAVSSSERRSYACGQIHCRLRSATTNRRDATAGRDTPCSEFPRSSGSSRDGITGFRNRGHCSEGISGWEYRSTRSLVDAFPADCARGLARDQGEGR
jgi:hypothetical protein